jgi:DNA-directed RNA polymerase subunit RPC12/RpoP
VGKCSTPGQRHRSTVAAYTDRVELEERTIERLPNRCQNCGAKLTDAEKRAALTEGPPSGLVLCTTCAAEVVPVDEDEEAEAAG